MARRRSGSTVSRTARVPDVAVVRVPVVRRSIRPTQLLEDRRQFHPARALRPARSFFGKAHVVVRKPSRVGNRNVVPNGVRFEVPKNVAICIRRKERREVLIAKGAGGSGRPKRRNAWSYVSC